MKGTYSKLHLILLHTLCALELSLSLTHTHIVSLILLLLFMLCLFMPVVNSSFTGDRGSCFGSSLPSLRPIMRCRSSGMFIFISFISPLPPLRPHLPDAGMLPRTPNSSARARPSNVRHRGPHCQRAILGKECLKSILVFALLVWRNGRAPSPVFL